MTRSTIVLTRTCLLLSLASLAGCAPTGAADKSGDLEGDLLATSLADGDEAADAFTRALVSRGSIGFGETVESSFSTDGYFGWTFTAAAGARIVLDAVPLGDADTVLMVYGPMTSRTWSRARPTAVNDDYRGSLASHVELRAVRAGTYLVVVRDYWNADGSFSLSLGCTSGECRTECGADDSCPTGSECNRVVCIRAPCPSYCAPIDTRAPGDECDEAECGPAPRIVTLMCSDGSTGGLTGRCFRDESLVCGWEIRACPTADVSCGGRTIGGATPCPDGQYCAYDVSDICGWADATGVCRPRPDACITLYSPVCGCDGATYSNSCAAASAGVSVQHDGAC